MGTRLLSKIAGYSYLIIFFAAIFANFGVVENISEDPLFFIETNTLLFKLAIIAFLATVVFDVVVAWALQELYKHHSLSLLSTFFRLSHAIIMGIAIFKLLEMLDFKSNEEILINLKAFTRIWLIGLLFFGLHLILLGNIAKTSGFIRTFLMLAGLCYIIDTIAYFVLPNYEAFSSIFLIILATCSIIGEMSFAIWLITKHGKEKYTQG